MTQEFVTLPREVVEQALNALNLAYDGKCRLDTIPNATDALRAALDRPQNHIPGVRNMAQAGWKLVPVVPTTRMVDAARSQSSFPAGVWRAMLDAAPKPPTVKDSLTVEQPQADQPAMTPIAQRKLEDLVASGYTISGYSVYHEQKHQHGFVTGAGLVGWWKPEGVEYPQPLGEQEPVSVARVDDLEGGGRVRALAMNLSLDAPLYTHPQPKREPLTDEEIDKLCQQFDDPMRREMWIIGFKAAHNIK